MKYEYDMDLNAFIGPRAEELEASYQKKAVDYEASMKQLPYSRNRDCPMTLSRRQYYDANVCQVHEKMANPYVKHLTTKEALKEFLRERRKGQGGQRDG